MDSLVKIVLVGDSGVGKSSLLQYYCEGQYQDMMLSTIGVDYRTKKVRVGEDSYTAQIFDTAGQERFRAISQSYYRRAQGVMIVFDITKPASLSNVSRWLKELRIKCPENVCKMVLGNKGDQIWAISLETLKEYSAQHGVSMAVASAKTGSNVSNAFDSLVSLVVDTHNLQPHEASLDPAPKKNSSCCF